MKAKGLDAARLRADRWRVAIFAMAVVTASACGGAPTGTERLETYDEYTQALTNAVIGTPNGVTTIGPAVDGGSSASGASSGVGTSGSVGGSSGSAVASSGTVVASGSFASGSVSSGTISFSGVSTGTSTGPVVDGGIASGSADGGPETGGFGLWHFDDCSPTSNFLIDSSGAGDNAQHALGAACASGISGLGVEIRSAKDVITVPDQPQFALATRIAVAAWVKPTVVTGDQPIVIKRLNDETAFSLGIHQGNIEMSVVLTTGKTIISSAPIEAGVWSQVAGMFDGEFVYLFLNGQQFGQVYAAGTIRDVFAPLRIGATTQTQYLHGIVDEVFVSTQDVTAQQLEALACISNPSSVTVNPATSSPVPFDSTFHFDVNVTDDDVGFCQGKQYNVFPQTFDPTVNTVIDQPSFATLTPGTSFDFGVDATPTENATVGIHPLELGVFSFGQTFENLTATANLDVTQPTGCFVFQTRELMMTDVSVVGDPIRAPDPGGNSVGGGDGGISPPLPSPLPELDVTKITSASASGSSSGATSSDAGAPSSSQGVWTFGNLMRNIAPSAGQAPTMTEQLFDHWLTDQTVNTFTVSARPAIQMLLLDIWPRTANGELDLDRAPLRLQAIVGRVDLRNLANQSAGEGRFVFGVDDGFGNPQQFTVILEYNLPAKTAKDVSNWAEAWHKLGSLPFPSEQYNAALETITHRFIDRGSQAGAVNKSALSSLRTNEIALSENGRWELREFVLSTSTGFFNEDTVKETPDLSFNGTSTFANFVNANAAAIEAEVPGANDHTVPVTLEGQPFLAGSIFNDLIEWSAPGITTEDARFHASLNTCNGCHGPETNTTFLMITPRFFGQAAQLSPFLTGTQVVGQDGVAQTLNDLARRQSDLESLVCPSQGGDAGHD
jgi:concanavalin A-like lectin/glucanase superfamily protein